MQLNHTGAWGCSWEVQIQHGMVYTCQTWAFSTIFHASVAPVGTKAGSSAHPRATSRPRWHPQRWADPFQHPCHPRRRPCPRARRPNPPNPNPRGPVARECLLLPPWQVELGDPLADLDHPGGSGHLLIANLLAHSLILGCSAAGRVSGAESVTSRDRAITRPAHKR